MFRILEIIKKNLKLLIRSRTSALIVLVGPLLLMLLMGLAFNSSSAMDIKVGTFSEKYSELSNGIKIQLEDDNFKVVEMSSEQNCMDAVRRGDVHVCVVFPKDLSVQSSENVIFHVDKTRLNLVYLVINSISNKLSVKSSELSTALTTTLVNAVNNINKDVNDNSESISQLGVNLNQALNEVNNVQGSLSNIQMPNLTEIDGNMSEDVLDDLKSAQTKIDNFFAMKENIDTAINSAKDNLNNANTNNQKVQDVVKKINDNINSIQIKEVSKIVTPIKTEIKPVSSEKTYLDASLPSVLMLVLLFAGVFLASTIIISEKTSRAYFRNFITPTNYAIFLIGNYLSNMLVLILQTLVIFIVMFSVTKFLPSADALLNLIIIILLVSSVFILIGMLIGYLFKNEETATIGSITISFVMIFFSNIILPTETLPSAIRSIVNFNPVMLGETALRRTLLFGETLGSISLHVFVLLGYVVLLFVLVYLSRELTKRRVG